MVLALLLDDANDGLSSRLYEENVQNTGCSLRNKTLPSFKEKEGEKAYRLVS